MNSNEPMAQILGASWLFGTSDRSAAIAKLKELSRDIRPVIAHLATAQIWRSEMLSADSAQVDRWAQQVKRMPKSIQAGPLLMLGLAYERLGRREECLTALLQIPILHQDDYRLSAKALHRAAIILQNAGQLPQSRRLWTEITRSFPETRWSQTAREALQQADLEKPP
jgi:tetratricopeptide (TPR) repeat protein